MGYYIGTAKRVRQTRKAPLQLKKHNYFNFAEGKREAEEEEEELKPKAKEQPRLLGAREREQEEVAKRASEEARERTKRTSYREYAVDA